MTRRRTHLTSPVGHLHALCPTSRSSRPPRHFDVTFDDPGNLFYHCTFGGAPLEVEGPFGEAYNEFGMRGEVTRRR